MSYVLLSIANTLVDTPGSHTTVVSTSGPHFEFAEFKLAKFCQNFSSFDAFSSPEAALLLVSTKNRNLCPRNLVPRAHVSFGQHQDTELWNNQLLFFRSSGVCVHRLKSKRRVGSGNEIADYSRAPCSPCSFWSAPCWPKDTGSGKETAVRVLFFEHTHRISFVLSAKQICQT